MNVDISPFSVEVTLTFDDEREFQDFITVLYRGMGAAAHSPTQRELKLADSIRNRLVDRAGTT